MAASNDLELFCFAQMFNSLLFKLLNVVIVLSKSSKVEKLILWFELDFNILSCGIFPESEHE